MKLSRVAAIAVAALAIASLGLAHAQDKSKGKASEPEIKVLLENDKVRVTQNTFKPGDTSRIKRSARANYIVKGGTFERTTPDGQKKRYERKAGEVVWLEADSDQVVNVGKSTIVLISTVPK